MRKRVQRYVDWNRDLSSDAKKCLGCACFHLLGRAGNMGKQLQDRRLARSRWTDYNKIGIKTKQVLRLNNRGRNRLTSCRRTRRTAKATLGRPVALLLHSATLRQLRRLVPEKARAGQTLLRAKWSFASHFPETPALRSYVSSSPSRVPNVLEVRARMSSGKCVPVFPSAHAAEMVQRRLEPLRRLPQRSPHIDATHRSYCDQHSRKCREQ